MMRHPVDVAGRSGPQKAIEVLPNSLAIAFSKMKEES